MLTWVIYVGDSINKGLEMERKRRKTREKQEKGNLNSLRPPASTGQTCLLRPRRPDKMPGLEARSLGRLQTTKRWRSQEQRPWHTGPARYNRQLQHVCSVPRERGVGGEGASLMSSLPAPTLLFLPQASAPSISPPASRAPRSFLAFPQF